MPNPETTPILKTDAPWPEAYADHVLRTGLEEISLLSWNGENTRVGRLSDALRLAAERPVPLEELRTAVVAYQVDFRGESFRPPSDYAAIFAYETLDEMNARTYQRPAFPPAKSEHP